MKKIHRVLALLMAALMAIGLMTTAFAEPTIDPARNASLSIYKYDITKASEDGVWDAESYVSTGLHDDAVVDKLAKYAIQGVEFTYLKVADIAMNNEVVDGQRTVGVLYGFDGSERSNTVLSAIGLTAADAHKTDNGINYFTSDMLNNKLAAALAVNATTVKNALEATVKNGGVAMTETDATGHTSADQLEQGLYLIVETRVPENVTSTCNPFFVSLPMTTIDGAAWNYDVTVYPKNQTGNPTLDKTVREAKNSTGKNNGSLTDITDGYEHTASASIGDTVDYQIISTLPTITSKASSLSEYTYVDTMSKGINIARRRCGSGRRQRRRGCASGTCGAQRSRPPPHRVSQRRRHRAPQQCRANRRKSRLRQPCPQPSSGRSSTPNAPPSGRCSSRRKSPPEKRDGGWSRWRRRLARLSAQGSRP